MQDLFKFTQNWPCWCEWLFVSVCGPEMDCSTTPHFDLITGGIGSNPPWPWGGLGGRWRRWGNGKKQEDVKFGQSHVVFYNTETPLVIISHFDSERSKGQGSCQISQFLNDKARVKSQREIWIITPFLAPRLKNKLKPRRESRLLPFPQAVIQCSPPAVTQVPPSPGDRRTETLIPRSAAR